jgi:hypothetical protein
MRATASNVGLLQYCSWWATEDAAWGDRTTSEADVGTRFHSAAAEYARTRIRVDVDDDIREQYAHACDWIDSLAVPPGDSILIERSFAWDPTSDTAEAIGFNRDYANGNGRICGTVDLVLLTVLDGRPMAAMVWDWKTGNSLGSGPQLRALGLMVARTFGLETVTVAALDVSPDAIVEMAREELTPFELSAIAGELAELVAGVAGSKPLPGAHCGELFCPAKLHCPVAQVAAAEIVDVIPVDKLVRRPDFRLTDPIETAEHAIWAVAAVSLVGAKLDDIKKDIKAKCPSTGWVAADGRILREGSCDSTGFDQSKALALCRQLGATDDQIAALSYTYQKSTGLRVSGGGAKARTKRSKAA